MRLNDWVKNTEPATTPVTKTPAPEMWKKYKNYKYKAIFMQNTTRIKKFKDIGDIPDPDKGFQG